MGDYRLRVRRGDLEVEAEGQIDEVRKDIDKFIALSERNESQQGKRKTPPSDTLQDRTVPKELKAVFKYDDDRKLVSLRFPPEGENRLHNALLLVLYGFSRFAGMEEVPVTLLRPALEKSSLTVKRIDQVADPLEREGLIKRTGRLKASKYWLTNLGLTRAEEMTKEMARQV